MRILKRLIDHVFLMGKPNFCDCCAGTEYKKKQREEEQKRRGKHTCTECRHNIFDHKI